MTTCTTGTSSTDSNTSSNATIATVLLRPGSTGEEGPAQVERRTGAPRISLTIALTKSIIKS
jgi:hypothetical protein